MIDTPSMIVLVEDDDGMRRALQRLLHVAGFYTRAFDSAEAMLDIDGAANACCLVLDVQLSGMSGPNAYGALGVHRPPVVFITSHDTVATHAAVHDVHGDALLIKPFAGRDLLDAIRRVTGQEKRP